MVKKNKQTLQRNHKKSTLIQLILIVVAIILLNIVGGIYFKRIDLTAENRYSLSSSTKEMLSQINDIVFFKVYLDGDFPAGFKKLKKEVKEMLDEFRAYNKNIQYQFVNPSEIATKDQLNNLYRQLAEKGLNPTELHVNENSGASTKIIFPGALLSYHDKEMAVNFLASQRGQSPEAALNESVQNLEYNIADGIQKVLTQQKKSIGFVMENSILSNNRLKDIKDALSAHYLVKDIRIDEQINALVKRTDIDSIGVVVNPLYDLIVFPKPDSVFSDKDKFIIDQYLMYGGKILWMIDGVRTSMDSLQNEPTTIALTKDMGLQDLFFNYGFRINTNLIMDINCASIPIVAGSVGGQPQYKYFPWYYFPVVSPISNHPIVANINNVRTEFVSSIDTISSTDVKKTPLLYSSEYTRLVNSPAVVSLKVLKDKPNPKDYIERPKITALLLEGSFKSFYKNRITTEIRDNKLIAYKSESKPTKMVVVSDGDVIANQLHYSKKYPLPLGFDQYTGQTFGNKEFILNAVNYLLNDDGIILTQKKDFKIRLLDETLVHKHRGLIQIVNVVIPVVILLLFALIYMTLRKRKYR